MLAAWIAGLVSLLSLGLSVPAAHAARPKTDLTLTLTSTSQPKTGDRVTFTGAAPKGLAGSTAKLMRRVGKKGDWIKVGSGRIGADGSFALRGVATGVGTNTWRATVIRNKVVHQSRVVGTKVFGWFYLSELEMVDEEGFEDDAATIGGKSYVKSVMNWDDSDLRYGYTPWAEWNVSYRCKSLNAQIGVDDDSETGMKVGFSVYLDGAETDLGEKGLGPASAIDIDTSDRLRVKVAVRAGSGIEDSDIDGYGVFGNAKVLCSGKP
jgi:hypothetical protein